jgi:hypothetical protein
MVTRDELDVDVVYYVEDIKQYMITPDGVGCFWYDSLTDVIRATGIIDEARVIDSVED